MPLTTLAICGTKPPSTLAITALAGNIEPSSDQPTPNHPAPVVLSASSARFMVSSLVTAQWRLSPLVSSADDVNPSSEDAEQVCVGRFCCFLRTTGDLCGDGGGGGGDGSRKIILPLRMEPMEMGKGKADEMNDVAEAEAEVAELADGAGGGGAMAKAEVTARRMAAVAGRRLRSWWARGGPRRAVRLVNGVM